MGGYSQSGRDPFEPCKGVLAGAAAADQPHYRVLQGARRFPISLAGSASGLGVNLPTDSPSKFAT